MYTYMYIYIYIHTYTYIHTFISITMSVGAVARPFFCRWQIQIFALRVWWILEKLHC